jgi:hypothetical protein
MRNPGLWLRSLAFNVGWYLGSVLFALAGAPLLLAPRRAVVAWARAWIVFVLWWLRITCGLTHRVIGLENLPGGPVIIACKHQSSWETLAFTLLFSDIAIVLKRELLFIPIVGWARRRRIGPAWPGQAGQGGNRRRPVDRDLPRRDEGGAGRPAAIPGRHGGPLSPARRTGGTDGAQFGRVLGSPEVDQAPRHDYARGIAADCPWTAPGDVHGNPAGPDRNSNGASDRQFPGSLGPASKVRVTCPWRSSLWAALPPTHGVIPRRVE